MASLGDHAFEAAPGLVRKILEIDLANHATHADLHDAGGVIADLARVGGDQAHAGGAHLARDEGEVGLIAAEPVKGFHGDGADLAMGDGLAQAGEAGAVARGGARNGGVGKDQRMGAGEARLIKRPTREPQLVLDGLVTLQIAGIAGIEGGRHDAPRVRVRIPSLMLCP
nr:hypothetical protein [Oceanicaulis sp. HTCC2633]